MKRVAALGLIIAATVGYSSVSSHAASDAGHATASEFAVRCHPAKRCPTTTTTQGGGPSLTTAPPTLPGATTTAAPSTTTTSTPATVTTAPTTTAMPPMDMGLMPHVNSFAAPNPWNWTQPFVIDQQYPYQVSDGTGAFRITTHFTNFGYADPIAFPGGQSPHLHQFFGNKCVTPTMTDPLACSGTVSDGGTLNKTAYWIPAMIDAGGNAVTAMDMQVYYKTGYKGVAPASVQPFPAGLKILAGSAANVAADTDVHSYDRIINYQCNNSNGTEFNHIPTNAEGNAGGCAPGTWFVMSVEFPQCWDGVHLDSADHKSHMAQANGGCPASHPVALPEITERAIFIVPAGGIPNGWRLSSDNYAYNGSNAGYSGHADWWNGWDAATMQQIIVGCENVPRDCSMDLLGNGKQLTIGPI